MPIMRIGIRSVLDRYHDIRVIAEAEHGHHVIGRMMKNPPQIILMYPVSIPSRGFWFFEVSNSDTGTDDVHIDTVSIPSRGFWFFEAARRWLVRPLLPHAPCFNPLAGILVF